MDKTTAQRLVRETFKAAFDKKRYRDFINDLCNGFDEGKAERWTHQYVKNAYKSEVSHFERIATYTDPHDQSLDVLVVHLKRESSLERARSALRNFAADYLATRGGKDAALIAFVSPAEKPNWRNWRFSFVRMDYATRQGEDGKIKITTELTPARRYSYLVGVDEECHTAQSRFLALLRNTSDKPTLADIEEAFSVESVTVEFFREYKRLFEDTEAALAAVVKRDQTIRDDFKEKGVTTIDFAKKLLGQIVFLYFIQKKGWLGVEKGGNWGHGPRNFLRQLADRAIGDAKCLFNDVLEPLFYDTLATDRGHAAWCKIFACRIPFLNGGLFEPLAGYDWEKTNISFKNELFTNHDRTAAGDVGSGILDVFDRYNFTVNESEPLEIEVAIDPEMLGKVFENLIEDNRRKGLGAFYTPREIVHYMCQESLINYLDNGLNRPAKPNAENSIVVPRNDVEDWIRQSDQFAHYAAAIAAGTKGDHYPKPPEAIRKFAPQIDALLRDITVCDPAIGSGAFPVGMMTEIVRARSSLTPYLEDELKKGKQLTESERGKRLEELAEKTTIYALKKHAIQHCLYGVDIDPGAVEIAKLRLWLSLVVDEEDVKTIKPLPNLDYKIVTGNSLMGVEKNLFNNEQFDRLEALKPKFFDESNRGKKAEYKRQIEKLIHELTNGREAFDFEIYFSEVFHAKGGFDAVIANPPYVGEKGHKEMFRELRKGTLGSFYQKKMDVFYFFFHQALNIGHSCSHVAFITTNYYPTATGAKTLRKDFRQRAVIQKLINFNEIKLFESAQGQHNMITLLGKGRNEQVKARTCVTGRKGFTDAKQLQTILEWRDANTDYFKVSQADLYEGPDIQIRIRGSSATEGDPTQMLLAKMKAQGEPLEAICYVNQGLRTGADKVSNKHFETCSLDTKRFTKGEGIFILRQAEVARLSLTGYERKRILPLFKNSDVHKYVCESNSQFKFIDLSWPGDRELDLSLVPNLIRHLSKYREILENRKENANGLDKAIAKGFWWPMSVRRKLDFSQEKIVAPQRSRSNVFGYNNIPWYASADVYFITTKMPSVALKFVLALLNSKLYFVWLYFKGKRKGEMLELYQKPLSEIPIKLVSAQEQNPFVAIVDKILAAKQRDAEADTSGLEREIDDLVYALYGLTPEEIQLVEGAAK